MWREILDIIIASAEGAFIEVTAFVGAVLLIFGYIDYLLSGRLVQKIEDSKKLQPVIGAFLGLTPGCGGAIFVMPLFPRRMVTFGTVNATLLATMGDSAFVLMTAMPKQFLLASAIAFVVAIIVGYLIDLLPLGERLLERYEARREKAAALAAVDHAELDHDIFVQETGIDHESWEHIGHAEGDEIDLILHHQLRGHQPPDSLGYKLTHQGFAVFWVFIVIGLILGILSIFQVDLNDLFIPNLGAIWGTLGSLLCIVLMIFSNKFLSNESHEEEEMKLASLKETFIHNAQETAFVGTWVFVAYLAYELFVLLLGSGSYAAGEAAITGFLTQTGLISVIIGVLVGVIPGCGPQIIFVSLFIRGMVPFSALLANAISQDGDALFPLIAIDKLSAFWATVVTGVTALIVGLIAYWVEFTLF
ncbi:MAG: arsenic efflux protein [Firmicutes bacterium]|jgi:MFS family permease|nr:putative manganese transporter [Bacillota bacterium]NLO66653.1 arsenic efflux protein [Bacillota bacterium]